VAVNSATSALHIACLALDLGPGDWLWTSPNTFVSSANCALYCGANVDFVDIDSSTYNLCPQKLELKLIQAEKNDLLPKIVIPVHYAGQPCNMSAIHTLSQKYGFKIIEDASHALGATYDSIKVGSCIHSDVTVFSFHPVKIITTGEGGLAVTNDDEAANHMRRLRAHGITNDQSLFELRSDEEIWNYQQIQLGFNYRMTDIEAVLGLSQMNRVEQFVARRREIAHRYDRELEALPLIRPWQQPHTNSSYHLYPVRLRSSDPSKTQAQLYDHLLKNDIAANLHYIPVHRQPYYESLGFENGDFPEAEIFHQEVISLPIYPRLESEQQEFVIETLKSFFVS
jgi:UDP-4-amino-4,6-dideoxy-N-acetyl-beta-L-altrosamine transaminase